MVQLLHNSLIVLSCNSLSRSCVEPSCPRLSNKERNLCLKDERLIFNFR